MAHPGPPAESCRAGRHRCAGGERPWVPPAVEAVRWTRPGDRCTARVAAACASWVSEPTARSGGKRTPVFPRRRPGVHPRPLRSRWATVDPGSPWPPATWRSPHLRSGRQEGFEGRDGARGLRARAADSSSGPGAWRPGCLRDRSWGRPEPGQTGRLGSAEARQFRASEEISSSEASRCRH